MESKFIHEIRLQCPAKKKKTSRIGFPPRLFRSSSSAGWKAKRQGSRPWTIPVGCDLPPTCCLVSFKQSFHLRFLYDLSSVENKAIFTLNYIISHFGRKQQERRLVVTLRTDELKVSSHRKPWKRLGTFPSCLICFELLGFCLSFRLDIIAIRYNGLSLRSWWHCHWPKGGG